MTASTSLLVGCEWNTRVETVEVVKEVRKPVPEAYLEHCKATRTGSTVRHVIGDYKQALDECNGQLDAIKVLQEDLRGEQDGTK